MKKKTKGMKKYLALSIIVGFLTTTYSYGQTIDLTNPNMTPAEAVENVLLGAGIDAFNITYNGSAPNATTVQPPVKRFNSGTTNFPIPDGVVLTTENAPANSDPDLNAIASNTVTNGVVIEFDFVPSGDTLSFNYIFASSEYSSYTCTQYNDVFGFFISGPGINGSYTNNAMNIATVPNSNNIPVGINSVNGGSPTGFGSASNCAQTDPNWQANNVYFTTDFNTALSSMPADPDLNGSTVVLPANSNLSCNDTFHIKLALTNVGDQVFDSAVFLEANSFSSDGVDINIETNTSTSDSVLIEGCTEGFVYFTRPFSQINDSMTIYFDVDGTATMGDDFPVLAQGDSVMFIPGEDTVSLVISPIDDGIDEGLESVIISAFTINACGDTVYSEGTIWIANEPITNVISSDTTVLCASDSIPLWVDTEGGVPPFSYEWETGETGSTIIGEGPENGTFEYIVTSIDDCGFEFVDTARIVVDQKLKIDSLVQIPADCGEENGAVVGYGDASSYTGTPSFKWRGPGANNPNSINATAWPDKPAGWYYFTITDDVCTTMDSILLEQNPPPEASFTADPTFGGSPLNVTFTNTSEPASSYAWDFGNGESNTVSDLSEQYSTYIDEGVYTATLTLTEGNCTDQASQIITVKLPLIYDLPNIFTPNGDGENDFFTINAENAASIDVVILNRWGNVVFESTDTDFKWNGKKKNDGAECSDGVYFFKFTITNTSGEEFDEHGFVHLVRDS